jgi:hypothetical protein
MKRFAAWAASIAFLTAGLVSALGAMSLLRPATNPMSEAAPGFQASVFQGTALAALLFFLAEAVASRWSAPEGGWSWGWVAIGSLFLLVGAAVLLEALLDSTALAGRTHGFRLGIGGLWAALGLAGCAVPMTRRVPRRPV